VGATTPGVLGGGGRRIPLAVKVAYTAFVCALVPVYLYYYGPTNFLYFCDVALLMTVPALWLESALLASTALVGILLPQLLWQVDFIGGLLGHYPVGMTKYMSDAFQSRERFVLRGLSFFHFWLPLLLLYAVWRLGYHRRAFTVWTALAIGLMLVCYFLMPAPPPPKDDPNLPVNINYVYGLDDDAGPQQWMPPLAWLGLLVLGLPLGLFLPAHLLLNWLFRSPPRVQFPLGETPWKST
jgi:hypothetical protein